MIFPGDWWFHSLSARIFACQAFRASLEPLAPALRKARRDTGFPAMASLIAMKRARPVSSSSACGREGLRRAAAFRPIRGVTGVAQLGALPANGHGHPAMPSHTQPRKTSSDGTSSLVWHRPATVRNRLILKQVARGSLSPVGRSVFAVAEAPDPR